MKEVIFKKQLVTKMIDPGNAMYDKISIYYNFGNYHTIMVMARHNIKTVKEANKNRAPIQRYHNDSQAVKAIVAIEEELLSGNYRYVIGTGNNLSVQTATTNTFQQLKPLFNASNKASLLLAMKDEVVGNLKFMSNDDYHTTYKLKDMIHLLFKKD